MLFRAGYLEITVNKITDLSTTATGTTDSDASVVYVDSKQTVSGKASSTGNYALTLANSATVGDVATIKSNKDFLTTQITTTISGSVSISFLPDIPFNAFAVPKNTATVKRLNPDWLLQLTDTRPNGGKWFLYLSQKSALQSPSETIENAVVFTNESAENTLDSTPILVARGVFIFS